jgi:hypothetical protein
MKKFAIILFAAVLFLAGCKDETNPVEQEEHFEPEGWLIEDSTGTPFLVVWQAEIQSTWNSINLQDRFTINVGQSLSFRVKFLDSERGVMEYPDIDYTLGWQIANTSFAEISPHVTDKWIFILSGLTTGSTTVELRVLHGGHADVKTPLLSVDVF